MIFEGITGSFSLENEDQYNTIGEFWDTMASRYGLENLRGLGYRWSKGRIEYAIGLKNGTIPGADFTIELPDSGWITVKGKTEFLKEMYDEIYTRGAVTYEIETFYDTGECIIEYFRDRAEDLPESTPIR